jgi:hypothetical protein
MVALVPPLGWLIYTAQSSTKITQAVWGFPVAN